MDPEHGEGAKIPDLVAFPSGTFQLTKLGVISTTSTGDTVGIYFRPIIGDASIDYPILVCNGGSSGSLSTQTNTDWPGRSAVGAIYGLFRPVSASVELFFIGNSTADGGRICGGCMINPGNIAPSTYSTLENRNETDEWPQRNGMIVNWKPLDVSNHRYVDASGRTDNDSIEYPVIMVAATGLPVSTVSIGYKVICNFEAIPSLSYADLVESTPSPFDQGMLRKAFEWAAESGNNIRALVNTVGPYVQTGMNLLQSGQRIANQLGYDPLPQRARFNRGRGVGIRLDPMMSNSTKKSNNIEASSGKEEEQDIEVAEAEHIFDQLKLSEPKSSSSPSLRIGTPKASPIALRKVGGQG